jgi:hypothetical protein
VHKVALLMIVGTAVMVIVRSVLWQVETQRLVSVKLQLALGILIGGISAAAVLSDRIDLVPDWLEWPLAAAFVGVAGMTWTILSVHRRQQQTK